MNNEKNKFDKKLLFNELFSFLIAAVLCVGSWLVGYFFVQTNTTLVVLAVVGVVGLFIAAIVNFWLYRRFGHNLYKMNVREANDFLNEKKADIENNYAEAEKNVDKHLRTTFVTAVVYFVLFIVVSFLLGAAEPKFTDDDGGVSLSVLPLICLIQQGIVAFLTVNSRDDGESSAPDVDEKDFPLIASAVKESAKLANIDMPIRLVLSMSGIGVAETKNELLIFLNPVEVALLTRDELKSVMLHEFAHFINSDTARSHRYERFNAKISGSLSQFGIVAFLGIQISQTVFATELYNVVSSRKRESDADAFVIEKGEAQNYVNATAKAALYSLYRGYEWKATSFDVFAGDEPVSDYTHRDLANFKTQFEVYRDRWFFTLENELPQRVDSHPTFAMRKKACAVETFDAETVETDEKYIAEQDKLLSFADKEIHDTYPPDVFALDKQYGYTAKIELFKKYEAATGDDLKLYFVSDNEILEIAQAYIGVDDQKALEILGRVLENSNISLAYFLKGLILSREYDDGCIDAFKAAAKNSAFFEESMEHIAVYALKTGKQELIDTYRKNIVDDTQKNIDNDKLTEIVGKKLSASDGDELLKNEIVGAVKSYWGDALRAVYLAEYTAENGVNGKYVALEVDARKNKDLNFENAHSDTRDMLFRLCDEKSKFYLFYFGPEFKRIKKTPGALIYQAEKMSGRKRKFGN